MKKCILLISTFFIFFLNAQSQVNEPQFDWCSGIPTSTNISDLNQFLAHSNAPTLFQQTKKLAFDIPVQYDFDGDLLDYNNWDNAVLLDNPKNPPTRSVYYAVQWTQEYFIITYSFFYPRNWTVEGFIVCQGDHAHNNDFERVQLIIDRCTGEYGITTTHHGNQAKDLCNENSLFENHPLVFSSWGSHAMYLNFFDAIDDGLNQFNPCHPNDVYCFQILFPSLDAPPVDFSNPCSVGNYNLIDIFESGGLWDNRGSFSYTGDECAELNNIDGGASAPWNGDLGVNPLNNYSSASICDKQVDINDEYIYNPYDCDGLEIEASAIQSCVGSPITYSLINDCSQIFDYDGQVTWNIPDGLQCQGCDEMLSSITITPNEEGAVLVSASVESISCGSLDVGHVVSVISPSPIQGSTFFHNFPADICAITDEVIVDASDWADIEISFCNNEGIVSFAYLSNVLSEGLFSIAVEFPGIYSLCYSATNYCGHTIEGQFNISVIDCHGGQRSSEEDIISSDKKSNVETNLEISPNPTRNTFSLNLSNIKSLGEEIEIMVTDIYGQVVIPIHSYSFRELNPSNIEYSLDQLPSGVYFLSAKINSQRFESKIIKIN